MVCASDSLFCRIKFFLRKGCVFSLWSLYLLLCVVVMCVVTVGFGLDVGQDVFGLDVGLGVFGHQIIG